MIIVEGADNVGKSTLIKQLIALDPRLRILHRDRFDPKQQETIGVAHLRALVSKDGDRVSNGYSIADRFLASECIYGKLFRGGSRFTKAEHQAIQHMLKSYQAIVVFCDPPDDVIIRDWKQRQQLYDDPLVIAHAYRKVLHDLFESGSVFSYDWTKDNAPDFRAALISLHKRLQEESAADLTWWSAMPHGIGCLREPTLILIGETLSPNAHVPVPFASGPAGDFLSEVLDDLRGRLDPRDDWRARDIYVTNALKSAPNDPRVPSDAVILREELSRLIGPLTVVITLGRVAEEAYSSIAHTLPRQPNNYAALPHPQFWRRFKYSQKAEYVQQFMTALADGRVRR